MFSLRLTTSELKIHELKTKSPQVYSTALISERDDRGREKQKHPTHFQQSYKAIHASFSCCLKFLKTSSGLINCNIKGVRQKLCIIIYIIMQICREEEPVHYHVWPYDMKEWVSNIFFQMSFLRIYIYNLYTYVYSSHILCVTSEV